MNNIDDHVDDLIFRCITPSSQKSFFLFAGAGSGKTRTLVNILKRFKEEFGEEYKLKNRKIAVITYTNAAANEIIDRLEYSSIFDVSTIHSFCWRLIKSFTFDIKNWVAKNLEKEIADLKEKQSRSRNPQNKTSLNRAHKIDIKNKRLKALGSIKKFIYNPDGDNVTENSLSHNEVISITSSFIAHKELFRQILINKHPIILIDESQDTRKELIEALFELESESNGRFILGLFGDTMQRIYMDGKERLDLAIPNSWEKPEKKMNHRSKSRIVDLINKIRADVDGQIQQPRTENNGGIVRFFVVLRSANKIEIEEKVCNMMKEITEDKKWSGELSDIMTLTLEHHMAAKRMGFSTFFDSLYGVSKLKTCLLDGSCTSVNYFTKIILPIYNAHLDNNKFEIANIIKKQSHLLSKENIQKADDKLKLFHEVNYKVENLLSLWTENKQPTLEEIIINLDESSLFKFPTTLELISQRSKIESEQNEIASENIEVDDDDDDLLLAWDKAIKADFKEVINYNEYINEESKYGTHQGVKGLEFDRVLLIIDDEESKGFSFSYDKLFDIKQLTAGDLKNIEENKETGIDRTNRLFYVGCSRAKESLAIVCYTDTPSVLKNNVISKGWFEEDEVVVLE